MAEERKGIVYPDQDFELPEGWTTKIEIAKPAHEQRDPDPSKDYGIGCVHIMFTLVAPDRKSAIGFEVFTGWYLPEVAARGSARPGHAGQTFWHHSTPQYESHEAVDDCLLLDGPCYVSTGFTIGDEIWEAMVRGGEPGLWKKLYELVQPDDNGD